MKLYSGFSLPQGPESAVPVVAVALPRGGGEEPAGLDVRGRGAGAAGQEWVHEQRQRHLSRQQRGQRGGREDGRTRQKLSTCQTLVINQD